VLLRFAVYHDFHVPGTVLLCLRLLFGIRYWTLFRCLRLLRCTFVVALLLFALRLLLLICDLRCCCLLLRCTFALTHVLFCCLCTLRCYVHVYLRSISVDLTFWFVVALLFCRYTFTLIVTLYVDCSRLFPLLGVVVVMLLLLLLLLCCVVELHC